MFLKIFILFAIAETLEGSRKSYNAEEIVYVRNKAPFDIQVDGLMNLCMNPGSFRNGRKIETHNPSRTMTANTITTAGNGRKTWWGVIYGDDTLSCTDDKAENAQIFTVYALHNGQKVMKCRMRFVVYWYFQNGIQRACEITTCKTRIEGEEDSDGQPTAFMSVTASIGGCGYKGAVHKTTPHTKDIYTLRITGNYKPVVRRG